MRYDHKAFRDLCKGQPCYLSLPGCRRDPDYTVPVHLDQQEAGKGAGIKSSDVFTYPGCDRCHAEVGGHGTRLNRLDRHFYADRAWRNWIRHIIETGLIWTINQPRARTYKRPSKIIPHPGVL